MLDVEQRQHLPTHGGSLRIYAKHAEDRSKEVASAVVTLLAEERTANLDKLATYGEFAEKVRVTKRKLLQFLVNAKENGKSIAAYGAPAKGNTLLNYCGVRTDFIDYAVDCNPHKQGMYLPGTHIPIYEPDHIFKTKPDYLLILPWNLRDEIVQQMSGIRQWGGQFVVPIPEVTVVE